MMDALIDVMNIILGLINFYIYKKDNLPIFTTDYINNVVI